MIDKKKKVKKLIIIYFIVSLFIFIFLEFFSSFYFDIIQFSELLFIGIFLIFISLLSFLINFVFYKYGIIFDSPWRNAAKGGEYSWWIEEEIETEVYWRTFLTSLVISISLLIIGISLIIIDYFFVNISDGTLLLCKMYLPL